MDHTDKQGHRHVQDKEEKKVMSSEFYVCLGGTMSGNTGIFDGEAMHKRLRSQRRTPGWISGPTATVMAWPAGGKTTRARKKGNRAE